MTRTTETESTRSVRGVDVYRCVMSSQPSSDECRVVTLARRIYPLVMSLPMVRTARRGQDLDGGQYQTQACSVSPAHVQVRRPPAMCRPAPLDTLAVIHHNGITENALRCTPQRGWRKCPASRTMTSSFKSGRCLIDHLHSSPMNCRFIFKHR